MATSWSCDPAVSTSRYRAARARDVAADERSCARKKYSFPCQRNAQILGRALGHQLNTRYAVYKCLACGRFHLRTYRPKEQNR